MANRAKSSENKVRTNILDRGLQMTLTLNKELGSRPLHTKSFVKSEQDWVKEREYKV